MNEIRITNVNDKVLNELKTIAKNEGVDLSSMLKPRLRKIVEEYPEWMRRPKPNLDD